MLMGAALAADPARMTNNGVGEVTIGLPIAKAVELAKVLGSVQAVTEPSGEGEQELRYLVRMNSKTAMRLEENEGALWRITVLDLRFRDNAGIGVGSTLAEVQARYPGGRVEGAEGGYCLITPAARGRSFCFAKRPTPQDVVNRIFIFGNL